MATEAVAPETDDRATLYLPSDRGLSHRRLPLAAAAAARGSGKKKRRTRDADPLRPFRPASVFFCQLQPERRTLQKGPVGERRNALESTRRFKGGLSSPGAASLAFSVRHSFLFVFSLFLSLARARFSTACAAGSWRRLALSHIATLCAALPPPPPPPWRHALGVTHRRHLARPSSRPRPGWPSTERLAPAFDSRASRLFPCKPAFQAPLSFPYFLLCTKAGKGKCTGLHVKTRKQGGEKGNRTRAVRSRGKGGAETERSREGERLARGRQTERRSKGRERCERRETATKRKNETKRLS